MATVLENLRTRQCDTSFMHARALCVTTLAIVLCPLGTRAATADTTDINRVYVDMGTPGATVSESMYGMFFEEINHAGDGGLYAELLQNRGFEEHVIPSGTTYADGTVTAPHALNYYGLDYVDFSFSWDIESKKYTGWEISSSGCTLAYDVLEPDTPLHENTPNALHLEISDVQSGAAVNVDNTGYWGVAVEENAVYKLRFYLCTSDYAGSVTASLLSGSGTEVATTTFDVEADGQWHEYTAELTAGGTFTDGVFRLQFSAQGTVDVDYVSLFPEDTFMGRENGLRKDVAEMLAGLHPAFLRWPGGCIVEGLTLENRVKWKETLGDPMERRGEYSLWGYRSTYGLGYYEFLQFCEDLGMDGMFVANVGMSCSNRNGDYVDPTDEEALLPYLQDIRDAIDYALGDPATNEWAAMRSAFGHPDPFPLKYVELGNENGTSRYTDRFAYFYNTLKEEYPEITFINTLSWTDSASIEATDMYDVHWYVTPDEFYADATLFDPVQRGDFTVYAGEYAANNDVGSGTMDAALSEAVFIGGMERNSDMVTMASYAPLLTNVNQPNWSCNLIWLDNSQVMGRASYYVQKIFADNRPDYNVKTRIHTDRQDAVTRGCVGFGTWSTQACFRNLRVTSNDGDSVYYESDLLNGQDEWNELSGTWTVNNNGWYAQTSSEMPAMCFMNAYSVGNCTVEVEACKTGGAEGFFFAFGADTLEQEDYYRFNIGGWGNTLTGLEKVTGGGSGSVVSDQVATTVATGTWYTLKMVMREGESVDLYMDDELVLSYALMDILPGRVQAFGGYDSEAGEVVLKVVNATDSVMDTEFVVNAANIQSAGTVITLQADDLDDENSLDDPLAISPVETSYEGFASTFTYTVQPRSLTIMRIKADADGVDTLDIPSYAYSDELIELQAPKQAKALALSNLQALAEFAEDNYIDGTDGSEQLLATLTDAQTLLATEGVTTKALNEGYDDLSDALADYFTAMMDEDTEWTSLITNADFSSMDATGWQGSTPSLESNVGEFFNCTFNTYQNLTGLENGYYLLYVQGFYRDGSASEAYERSTQGETVLRTYLYANSSKVLLRSLYSDGEDMGTANGYADNRTQAEAAFNTSADTYANYLIAEVDDGTLRIGLRKTASSTYDWACFNNFRLFLALGEDATSIENVSTDAAAVGATGTYTLSGQRVNSTWLSGHKGVFIVDGEKVVL